MADIKLCEDSIDPAVLRQELVQLDSCGGLCSFEGLIRNHNHGKKVAYLEYEAYPELALSELKKVCAEAQEHFELEFALVHHRIGRLAIGDVAVVIYTLAHHRDEAFKGCRYIIDELKTRVPIWKKEHYLDASFEWTRCTHSPHANH